MCNGAFTRQNLNCCSSYKNATDNFGIVYCKIYEQKIVNILSWKNLSIYLCVISTGAWYRQHYDLEFSYFPRHFGR